MTRHLTWLIVGLTLRLVLIPIIIYSDLHAIAYAIHLFPFEGVTDIYGRLREIDLDTSPVPFLQYDFYTYPPLSYFFFGGAMWLFKPLYTDSFSAAISSPHEVLMTYQPQIFLWLTLYKLPFLPFDIGIAFLLRRFFSDQASKVKVFALWMLNPIPVIAGYMFGQFDVVPAFFVVLALLEFKRDHPWRSVIIMGIGACFKSYPLILIPAVAIVATPQWWKRGLMVLIGIIPFILSLQLVRGSPVALDVIFNSGPAQRIFRSTITLGDALDMTAHIYVFLLLYCLILFYAWYKTKRDFDALFVYLTAILLLAYAFSFSHLQWLTWSIPLIVLDWTRRPRNQFIHLVLIGTAIMASLTWQFGAPEEFLATLGFRCETAEECFSFSELIEPYIYPLHFANIMRTIFAGAAAYWTYTTIFRGEPDGSAISRSQT